ncbi:MAG: 1-acyl-sn-glycerol-3-phosphate acyltransferase [Clostridia bacterium]|nr:1-acyl-sn-glycerol-3-phosphate acyltransferase [Clostridia bacterium]
MFAKAAALLMRGILHILYFMRVEGNKKVPKEGGLYLCSNHSSYWDPVILGATCRRETKFMAKEELFKKPLFGALIRALGAYPIKRGGASEVNAVRTAMKITREGGATVIFPEGRRVLDPSKRPEVKNGIIKLAIQTKCPIQPVGINEKFRLFGGLKVVYGEPIYYEGYYGTKPSDEELDRLAKELMDEIYKLGGLE